MHVKPNSIIIYILYVERHHLYKFTGKYVYVDLILLENIIKMQIFVAIHNT